jgi:arylsulfatase A-like enzyme
MLIKKKLIKHIKNYFKLLLLKPNILFVVIDSLRADRIFGKEKKANTPNIDSLIKKGVYFSNAITTNQYTAQVMQSIFTARFPAVNRTKDNKKVNSNINPLLLLKNSGYKTFTTIQKDVFIQGFEQKFDNTDIFNSEENIYNGLAERILKKIDSLTDPWLYYIHLEDLHLPCVVPEKLQHLKLPERYNQNLSEIDLFIGKILKKIDLDETLIIITADHGEYISPADGARGEIADTKVNIKNLIKKFIPKKTLAKIHLKKQLLNQKNYASKTEIPHEKRNIVTNRMTLNNNLFDDIVHVPLIFAGNKINSIETINQQICNIDIFPTILELLEIPTTKLSIHGRSLVPLLKDKEFNSIPIYLTSLAIIKKIFQTINIDNSLGPLVGIRTADFKYFRDYKDPEKNVHLYDLKNDPFEDNNIFKIKSNIIKKMELSIEKIQKNSLPLLNEEEISQDEIKKAKESLKKMGYI